MLIRVRGTAKLRMTISNQYVTPLKITQAYTFPERTVFSTRCCRKHIAEESPLCFERRLSVTDPECDVTPLLTTFSLSSPPVLARLACLAR